MRFGLVLAVLAICTSCTVPPPEAPDHLVSARWSWASAQAEAALTGPDNDLDVMGVGLTYEFLPFSRNGNIALTGEYRNHEFEDVTGSPTLKTVILKAGPRWNFQFTEDNPDWTWYAGPNIGSVVYTDADDFPGVDYGVSFFWDVEAGVRWHAEPHWGLEAIFNWGVQYLNNDNPATLATNVTGFNGAIGVWYDF